jgi:flagellar hook capping protein FlgD
MRPALLAFLVLGMIAPGSAAASLPETPLCVAAGDQVSPARERHASACNGVTVWVDSRNLATTGLDLFYSSGATGAALCAASGSQTAPAAAFTGGCQTGPNPDPSNPAAIMVAWQDARGSSLDIYAQRIRGFPRWASDGVPVCVAAGDQTLPVACGNLSGDLLVAWIDRRAGQPDVFAQRLDQDAAIQWTADGIPVCDDPADQSELRAVPDGSGGFYLSWTDGRGGPAIFVQRLQADGAPAPGWSAGGVRVCDNAAPQRNAVLTPAFGGVLVVWEDFRADAEGDLYAMLMTSAGQRAAGWPTAGNPLCTASGRQQPADALGEYVVWEDGRAVVEGDPNIDLYATRLASNGERTMGWAQDGMPVTQRPSAQTHAVASLRGLDGLIVAWAEPTGPAAAMDLYAQALDASGQVPATWPPAGFLVSDAAGNQIPALAAADGNGGAEVAWEDSRDAATTGIDLYQAYVGFNHQVGVAPIAMPSASRLGPTRPNPARGEVAFALALAEPRDVIATILDLGGREVARVRGGRMPSGTHDLVWDGRDSSGRARPPGVYFLLVQAGADRLSRRFVTLR